MLLALGASALAQSPSQGPGRQSPVNVEAALQLLQEGKPREAAQALETITRQEPNNAPAWRGLGLAHRQLHQPASAIEAYENCLKNVQSRLQRVRIRQYLANVLTEQNKTKEAVDDLKASLQEVPDYPGHANVEKRIGDLSARLTDKAATAAP
jgi:tetratricopeptide (TPR) repeat protein